jgi:large conductance mechanosensitive channel
MGMVKEFKEFALKGNMLDLAVGIIIGGGFGKVVSSIVADVLMPPLGVLIGGLNFTDIKIKLKDAILDPAGKITQGAVSLNIGNFIQSLVDFTVIAFVVFLLVKAVNSLNRKAAEVPVQPPALSRQEELLMEIRDLLKKK